jgi:prevent-host-death family protein
MKETTLSVSEFRPRCLRLLDEVGKHGGHFVITKRGRPIARVTPMSDPVTPLRGSWEGIVKGDRDIVNFDLSSDWEAPQ